MVIHHIGPDDGDLWNVGFNPQQWYTRSWSPEKILENIFFALWQEKFMDLLLTRGKTMWELFIWICWNYGYFQSYWETSSKSCYSNKMVSNSHCSAFWRNSQEVGWYEVVQLLAHCDYQVSLQTMFLSPYCQSHHKNYISGPQVSCIWWKVIS
jgi:hypothetical protein